MKQGIIYGGTFLFAFVIVTGLLIYLNSSYENIFELNFAPKSLVQLSDSTKTDSLNVSENSEPIIEPDSTIVQDSILLSSLGGIESNDSVKIIETDSINIKNHQDNLTKKGNEELDIKNSKTDLASIPPLNYKPVTQNIVQGKEYTEWVQKVTSIYSVMEPRKAAKIIQTYSDNVARDILYNMNKKTAAKVVSEFSPETANRIFRFE
jgi:4-amino-4-deoxy-L-arabinose transferase-like glycosyltransferase